MRSRVTRKMSTQLAVVFASSFNKPRGKNALPRMVTSTSEAFNADEALRLRPRRSCNDMRYELRTSTDCFTPGLSHARMRAITPTNRIVTNAKTMNTLSWAPLATATATASAATATAPRCVIPFAACIRRLWPLSVTYASNTDIAGVRNTPYPTRGKHHNQRRKGILAASAKHVATTAIPMTLHRSTLARVERSERCATGATKRIPTPNPTESNKPATVAEKPACSTSTVGKAIWNSESPKNRRKIAQINRGGILR